jgi:fumarate reductase (CoM/CoB) subunit B
MPAAKNNGETVKLWHGCTTRYYFDNTMDSLKSILKKMDLEFAVIDENEIKDSCCASTLWGIGLSEVAEENKAKMEPVIKENSQDDSQVVSPCPGCTLTFSKRYDIGKKPLHVTQFLSRNLDKMKLENSEPITVTYHDSCHLAKGLGVVEEPRDLIKKIPNLKFKELSYNGENGLCCGSGGGLRALNKDLADSMSSLIVKEAESLGAAMIITACPFCERSLNFGKEIAGSEIEVVNLLVLLDEHLA